MIPENFATVFRKDHAQTKLNDARLSGATTRTGD
jgi:hypothetical protein